ncbi:HTH-type transcriptional repressor PurR [Clarias magur]|uniref:HTH-type transcriptional repressor PurR n=1 Tax=Clarias magur TaxID=1594786 RepID=A0A8J4UA32_CLAMG|nr:HTH-type transcriptional repressor PurR [Clarias magur]
MVLISSSTHPSITSNQREQKRDRQRRTEEMQPQALTQSSTAAEQHCRSVQRGANYSDTPIQFLRDSLHLCVLEHVKALGSQTEEPISTDL